MLFDYYMYIYKRVNNSIKGINNTCVTIKNIRVISKRSCYNNKSKKEKECCSSYQYANITVSVLLYPKFNRF